MNNEVKILVFIIKSADIANLQGIMGRMKQSKRIRRKLNKGSKTINHTSTRYSILLIVPLMLLIFLPAVSLTDDERISQKSGMYKEKIEPYKQAIRINPDAADAHSALEQYKILKSLDPELANELFKSNYE